MQIHYYKINGRFYEIYFDLGQRKLTLVSAKNERQVNLPAVNHVITIMLDTDINGLLFMEK